MRKYLMLFALLAIVLAACRVESNVTLDINEDGSAVVGAEIGFDDEFKDLIAQSGTDPDQIFGDLPSFGDGETETTERTEGDMTYYGVTTQVDDLSAFDMAPTQGDIFSSFDYTFDEDSAQLDATLVSADIGDFGGDLPIDPSTITDEIFSANVIVKMPGTVTEHNADEVLSDGSLLWKIPFTGTQEITATSDFGSSNTNLILFILLGVLIIGIIAAVVATIVSRRESSKAVAAAAASHAASAGTTSESRADTADEPATAAPAAAVPPPPADDTAPALDTPPPSDDTAPPAEAVVDDDGAADRTIEVSIDDEDAEPTVAEQRWESEGGQPDST